MNNEQYSELLEYLLNEQLPKEADETYEQWASQFREQNNHIYVEERRLVPRYELSWILSMFHDNPISTHQGAEAMRQQINKRYVWKGMTSDIKEYVKSCYECQRRGGLKENNQKHTIVLMDIFERWGIDIVGPLPQTEDGYRYIVVAIDYFSRWPEARPLTHANARQVAKFIYEEIICRFGAPRVLQSDRGTHFVNEVIQELTDKFQIRHSLSSLYHLQSNGLVKRFNKILCEGLAKVAETINDWDSYIQPVLFSYQTHELRVTGQPPFTLVYEKNLVLAIDSPSKRQELIKRLLEITDKVPQLRTNARRAIKKAQAKLEETFNKKEVKFQKGDLVLYFDKALAARHDVKFVNKWKGPYEISHVLDKGAYKLTIDGNSIKGTVNGNLLKKYYTRDTWEPVIVI